MNKAALILAIVIPLAGTAFVFVQILRKEIKNWQHYVCFTILTIFVSVLLLGVSGNLKSFGYGDAKMEFVERKVEEAKELLEEIRTLAKTTGELSVMATEPQPIGYLAAEPIDYLDPLNTKPKEVRPYFAKHFRYAYQNEVRVIWLPPKPTPKLQPVFASLGSLEDIAELLIVPVA